MTDHSEEPRNGSRRADPGRTSLGLLERCARDDHEAWPRLVDLYYPLVYGWCRRLDLQPEDARDVSQEVFQSLVKCLSRFDAAGGANSFRGWLWGVTRNQLKTYWRRRSAAPVAAGGSDALQQLKEVAVVDDEEPPSDARQDQRLVFLQAVELMRGQFEEHTWQAFRRAVVDGDPACEIASDLGMTTNAVYLARSRVMRRLREELPGLLDL